MDRKTANRLRNCLWGANPRAYRALLGQGDGLSNARAEIERLPRTN